MSASSQSKDEDVLVDIAAVAEHWNRRLPIHIAAEAGAPASVLQAMLAIDSVQADILLPETREIPFEIAERVHAPAETLNQLAVHGPAWTLDYLAVSVVFYLTCVHAIKMVPFPRLFSFDDMVFLDWSYKGSIASISNHQQVVCGLAIPKRFPEQRCRQQSPWSHWQFRVGIEKGRTHEF